MFVCVCVCVCVCVFSESVNQTCYSQAMLVNYDGCGASLHTLYQFLTHLFLGLDLAMFLLNFILLVFTPVAI